MAPLDLSGLGHWGNNVVSVGIGVAFGFILERAGFGNARKLASQFYLSDMSVLKVMFTAIVVAMVLLHGGSAIGLIDMDRVAVNPTYLWPGIIGGLLLGVGFIIGGYCPGTSVVSAATLKLDGLFFLFGCLLGILVFGWTVPSYQAFWEQTSAYGRLTIPEWLGWNYGVVLLGVVIMALGMFIAAEWAEPWVNSGRSSILRLDLPRGVRFGGLGLLSLAGAVCLAGLARPDPAAPRLRAEAERVLTSRERHIEPAELLSMMHNNQVLLRVLDAREEAEYNLFHLVDSLLVEREKTRADWPRTIPTEAIKVVVSNDETRAEKVARGLMTRGVRSVYLLEGGLNRWLDTYGPKTARAVAASGPDRLRYEFDAALGAGYPAAHPDILTTPRLAFTPRVKFDRPVIKVSGGCGG
ncbi:MAG: YeeE/YedE thiosulfate transporter family protein [Isosphaeraceae bacterium]